MDATTPATRRRVVMAVDDDPESLALIERMLRDRYELLLANSGPQALAILADREVDLLLLDQRLGETTGIELFRKLRARHFSAPVVLTSAYADSEVLVAAINFGITRFISKPYRSEDLRAIVDSLAGAAPAEGATTILVVDDSSEIRELLSAALSRAGHRVVCAASAEQALDMLRTNVPDAALVDIALPGSSGLELTASLRQSLPHLPVIVVSAVESVDVAIEALRLGVTDYVTKPFRFREILFRLDRALELVRRTTPPGPTSNAAMTIDLEIPMAEHLQRAQRTYLQRLLARCEGDVAETARRAGVPVGEMDHLMSHLGLVASDHRQTQP